MKIFVLILTALSIEASAGLPPTTFSAARYPRESVGQAYQRFLGRLAQLGLNVDLAGDTPVSEARPIDQLDFSQVTRWPSPGVTKEAFNKVRDTRFITDPHHNNFMRRSSWLFPDDGCFARAALMGQNLEKWNAPRPAKAFIFGGLRVKTPNNPSGYVSWWYHVVPIVIVGQQPIILDPAINPKNPMTLKDWVMTMTDDPTKVKIALCDPTTYGPSSPCHTKSSDEQALRDQMHYLDMEWSRLEAMHRNPVEELGDNPPWLRLFQRSFNFEGAL